MAKVTDVMGRFKVQIRDIDMAPMNLMEVVFGIGTPGADKNAAMNSGD